MILMTRNLVTGMREKSEYISIIIVNYFLVGFRIHLLSNLMTGGYYLEQC